ncbi:MAG: hypothetical protein ACWA5Q_09815 [bacterium]
MPYFVYHVTTNPETNTKSLKYLETFDKYKEARAFARDQRANMEVDPNKECRMIFANNDVEAEKLLSKPREERVIGED